MRPALLRLRHVEEHAKSGVLDGAAHDAIGRAGERRWLLSLASEDLENDERVAAVLAKGKELRLPDGRLLIDRHLVARRGEIWYRVEAVARHYSGGLYKLEPRALLSVRVPQPDQLVVAHRPAVCIDPDDARRDVGPIAIPVLQPPPCAPTRT